MISSGAMPASPAEILGRGSMSEKLSYLAELPAIERDRLLPIVASALDMSADVLRARVENIGAALLDETAAFIQRFCALPDHGVEAATLWAAHAHLVRVFCTSPRLALLSPEPGSGKTRVLEVLNLLVPSPLFSITASPAAIFRTLDDEQITLLLDEVDAIFRQRGKDDQNEDLRALLNAGYKRGATIPRCVGPKHEVMKFPVFAAVALAGLGDLPSTIMTRAVILRMRRRAPNEPVEPFRSREHEPIGHAIRDRLAVWAATVADRIATTWPPLPSGIVDRPAEIWEPLIQVADAAGDEWPQKARLACIALVKSAQDQRVSLGVRLLGDLRIIFGGAEVLPTATIIERLTEPDANGLTADAPWSELHGQSITPRGLARLLQPYGVRPVKVKLAGAALQGYRRDALFDAWERYLPPPPENTEPSEPTPTAAVPSPFAGSGGSAGSGSPEGRKSLPSEPVALL